MYVYVVKYIYYCNVVYSDEKVEIGSNVQQ